MREAVPDYPSFVPNLIAGTERSAAGGGNSISLLRTMDSGLPGSRAPERKTSTHAVASARAAQPAWAATPGVHRGEILHAVANAIEARRDELAAIVALEAGKRSSDSLGEVGAAVQCARFFAGEGQRLFGRTMPSGTAAPDGDDGAAAVWGCRAYHRGKYAGAEFRVEGFSGADLRQRRRPEAG